MRHGRDFDRDLVLVESLEQTVSLAEENRRERDGELIDQPSVEILEDDVSAAGLLYRSVVGVGGTLSMSTIGLTSIVGMELVPMNPLAIAIASSRSFASMMV
jgi:hypothetical protein